MNLALEARLREEVAGRLTLQAQLEQAQKLQALGQLAGGIVHDFNNVLQNIGGGLALIERHSGDAEAVRDAARMTARAAERGAAVTRRLLAFTRRSEPEPGPVDVAALLEELGELLAHTLAAGTEVHLAAERDLPPLLADKGQLATVLVNLALNARDAMPAGGRITFGAAAAHVAANKAKPGGLAPGAYLELWVRDTGTGMDAATLARAREPFFTTKPPGKGTGLGLAMARDFAGRSRGALSIASEQGRGTTVALWLPRAPGLAG